MPPVLLAPILAAGLGELGTATIIGSLTVAQAVTGIASIGLSFGLQMLLAPGGKSSTQQGQVTAREANPTRLRAYGTVKLGGNTFFLESVSGAELYRGVAHCEGPIDSYQSWWLNDTDTQLPAGALYGDNSQPPWLSQVFLESHLGLVDDGASGTLTSAFDWWTGEHRLRGIAYTIIKCTIPPHADTRFQKFFPNGEPTLRVVLRASKVYDPRNTAEDWNNWGTWSWGANAGLCILDFLTYERHDAKTGNTTRYIPKSRINLASFSAFADLCDDLVPLASGGTERRYSIDGYYDLSQPYKDVLRSMLDACDAELVPFPDGTVGIEGGKWVAPTITITDAQVISVQQYAQGNNKLAAFNHLKWTFVDPDNDFQQIDGDPWDDLSSQTALGEVLTESISLPFVQSHSQGRRLCKIYTSKNNPRHKLTGMVVQMPALQLIGERMLHVRLETLNLEADFLITRFEPSGDVMTVTLDLSSLDASAYDWDPEFEEGSPPSVSWGGTTVLTPPNPTGVALSIVTDDIGNRVRASATPLTNSDGTNTAFWTLAGQIRPSGSGDAGWVPMNADGDFAVLSGYLGATGNYEVQVWYEGLQQESTFSGILAIHVS